MCTVTFIARQRGYCLGMNRDEKIDPAPGLPPKKRKVNGRTVLTPSEPGGGTWIAVNDHAAALPSSTGIRFQPGLAATPSAGAKWLIPSARQFRRSGLRPTGHRLPLKQINPFRLIAVYPATNQVVEWRWDRRTRSQNHPWKTQQWISSGFDEPKAQRMRGKTFRRALRQASKMAWPGFAVCTALTHHRSAHFRLVCIARMRPP